MSEIPMHDLTSRRLALALTIHARNGGGPDSFLPPDTPVWTIEDGGSDTEEEDNKELQDYYSNRMSDDTERRVEIVFGPGVEVWISRGGGIHIDAKVGVQVKKSARKNEKEKEEDLFEKHKDGKTKLGIFLSNRSSASGVPSSPSSSSLSFTQTASYRDQTNESAQSVEGSFADIVPITHTRTEDLRMSALRRRVVSGSFGTFEGHGLSRFDKRVYRLAPSEDTEKKNRYHAGRNGGGEGLGLFKSKPWFGR